MTIYDIIPKEILPFVWYLSKQPEWFEARSIPEDPKTFSVKKTRFQFPEKYKTFQFLLESMDARGLFWTRANCEVLKNGIKTLRPTLEQCESLEYVDIPLKLLDYQQPYPAVIVDLPKEYRDKIKTVYGDCPKVTIAFLYSLINKDPCLLVGSPYLTNKEKSEVFYLMHENGQTIEERLKVFILDGPTGPQLNMEQIAEMETEDSINQFSIGERLARITINLCLAATHFGHTEPTVANSSYQNKLLERCKKNPTEGNKIASEMEPLFFTIQQDITIRNHHSPGQDLGGTHASPKSHWRRGHWRMQPFGKGLTEKKRIFIRPIFIRGVLFKGNLGATRVEYTIPK